MAMIRIENLTFAYPASYDNVFENVSFQIDTDWKLGLIGRNGRGKTTLLKLLLGMYEYQGNIQAPVQFDYFPYPVVHPNRTTAEVLHEICPFAKEWEQLRELSYLDVRENVLLRPFSSLSNGEQTKVMLSALFLRDGHFLLIDEPTNHLDGKAREIVSAYLNKKRGFILVSHDRYFLDCCVNHILSINRSNITVQNGNFSSWFADFQHQQNFELAQNIKLNKEIIRMKNASRQNKNWSDEVEKTKNGKRISGIKPDKGYIGHKAAKMMKRAKTLEVRQQHVLEEKTGLLKNREIADDLKVTPLPFRAEQLAIFDAVAPIFDGKTVCLPVSFEIRLGERIALDGINGSGKSSLLKLLVGEQIEHSGAITVASGLVISYVPQNASSLKGDLRNFAKENHLDESLLKAILRKMDFSRTQFEKKMEDYSAGQKKKVLLAKSFCEKAHLYVWDEPLNYIDIYSRIQIENLIEQCAPSMIFVEHDRAFRNRIATKTILLG